jgi:hypothetical protein
MRPFPPAQAVYGRRVPARLLPWPCAACTFENAASLAKCGPWAWTLAACLGSRHDCGPTPRVCMSRGRVMWRACVWHAGVPHVARVCTARRCAICRAPKPKAAAAAARPATASPSGQESEAVAAGPTRAAAAAASHGAKRGDRPTPPPSPRDAGAAVRGAGGGRGGGGGQAKRQRASGPGEAAVPADTPPAATPSAAQRAGVRAAPGSRGGGAVARGTASRPGATPGGGGGAAAAQTPLPPTSAARRARGGAGGGGASGGGGTLITGSGAAGPGAWAGAYGLCGRVAREASKCVRPCRLCHPRLHTCSIGHKKGAPVASSYPSRYPSTYPEPPAAQLPAACCAALCPTGGAGGWVLLGSGLGEGPQGKGLLRRLAAVSGGTELRGLCGCRPR